MDVRYMVFGFQGSGKTTFAAALWHLVDSEEIPTALIKGKHVGDFSYLEEMAQIVVRGLRGRSDQVAAGREHPREPAARAVRQRDDARVRRSVGRNVRAGLLDEILPREVRRTRQERGGSAAVPQREQEERRASRSSTYSMPKRMRRNRTQIPTIGIRTKAPLQVQLVDLLQCLQRPPFEKRR